MIYEIYIGFLFFLVGIGLASLLGIIIGLSIAYYKIYIKSPESVTENKK